MTTKLTIAGILAGIFFVFFLNAILVLNTASPEEISSHFMGPEGLLITIYAIFLVAPIHIGFVIWAAFKKKVAVYLAFPYAFIPYMIGATIQGLMF